MSKIRAPVLQWNPDFTNSRFPETPDISNQTLLPLDLLHCSTISPPYFPNPRVLEIPDNSNIFWLPWDKLTLDNSNLAKTSKPLSSFSFSPRRRFVFQTEISGKYIVLVLVSRLFYFLSWGSVYRFLYRIQNARG